MKATQLSPALLERAAEVLRLLAHRHRLRIVEILEEEHEGVPVHRITEQADLPQAAVSRHLGQMQREGLVSRERVGKEVGVI